MRGTDSCQRTDVAHLETCNATSLRVFIRLKTSMTDMPAWQVTPIQAIKKVWEKIAPLQLAERSWDNVGVMIGVSSSGAFSVRTLED